MSLLGLLLFLAAGITRYAAAIARHYAATGYGPRRLRPLSCRTTPNERMARKVRMSYFHVRME